MTNSNNWSYLSSNPTTRSLTTGIVNTNFNCRVSGSGYPEPGWLKYETDDTVKTALSAKLNVVPIGCNEVQPTLDTGVTSKVFNFTQEDGTQTDSFEAYFTGWWTSVCGAHTFKISNTNSITSNTVSEVSIVVSTGVLSMLATTRKDVSFYVSAHLSAHTLFAAVPVRVIVRSAC